MGDIYKTTYEIVVYSDGPFQVPATDDEDPFDLREINYAITDGDCVGTVRQTSQEVVAEDKVVEELQSVGNDGEFFDYRHQED